MGGTAGTLVAHFNYDWLSERMTAARATVASSLTAETEDAEEVNFGAFYEMENMIVNPAESQGSRYLMVNVGFESDLQEVLTELENKEVVVRDRVTKLLSEFTVPELSDIDRRDDLKDTLRTSVNDVLREGEVRRLYFTQYVIQ